MDSFYDIVAEGVRRVADQMYWTVFFNPVLTLFVVLTAIAILVAWGVSKRRNRNKLGTIRKMAQRRAYLDRLFADKIGDVFANLLHEGKISNQEYRNAFKKFGKKHGLTDLLPKNTHPEAIKRNVKKNIKSMRLLDASGAPIQPRIPGPKPPEVVVPAPKEPKRWVAIRNKLLRRAA